MTDDDSFVNASKWITEIQKYTEEGIIINLIGNKYDLIDVDPNKRKVTEVEVGQFCNKEYLLFSEVSAKTGYNVRECFENFIESKRLIFFYYCFNLYLKIEIYVENEKRKKNIEPYQRFSFADSAIKLEGLEDLTEKKRKKKICCK